MMSIHYLEMSINQNAAVETLKKIKNNNHNVTHSDYKIFKHWWIFLLWTLSGIQAQTGEGDPGPEGAALTFEQSSGRTLQLFKLTEV